MEQEQNIKARAVQTVYTSMQGAENVLISCQASRQGSDGPTSFSMNVLRLQLCNGDIFSVPDHEQYKYVTGHHECEQKNVETTVTLSSTLSFQLFMKAGIHKLRNFQARFAGAKFVLN